jgi:cyclophilin family peptidyl-prolyl cis-trans isomerase
LQQRLARSSAATRRGFVAGVLVAGVASSEQDAEAMPFSQDEAPREYATLKVDLEGEQGGSKEVKIRLRPDWAPRGVKRFKQLVDIGEFKDAAFFHVDDNIATFGLPAEGSSLRPVAIKDDRVRASNKRGRVSFVARGEHSRVNELFINRDDNEVLDRRGLSPIGEVVEGDMDVVDQLFSGYQNRPDRSAILKDGNDYLDKEFPKLSKIKSVDIES